MTVRPTSWPGANPASVPFDDERVLTQIVEVAPANPWDQRRAAELQARLASPIPLEQLRHKIVRIDAWGPRRRGRYLAAYVRRGDVGKGIDVRKIVDGRSISIAFASPAAEAARRRQVLVIGAVYALSAVLAFAAVEAALGRRSDAEDRLQLAERRTASQAHQVAIRRDIFRNEALLRPVIGKAIRPAEMLRTLAWVSAHRQPDVHIEAIHWEAGLVALEVRGSQSPMQAGAVRAEKASQDIRPGVSLWAIYPDTPQDAILAAAGSSR